MLVIHLAFILCILVEAHSQTAPYVSFMGESLPNHSYVNLSLVGGVGSGNNVVCHTDLVSCCSSYQGPHRGDWYFPNGDRLPFNDHFLREKRHVQRVELSIEVEGMVAYHLVCTAVILRPEQSTVLTQLERQSMWDCTTLVEVRSMNKAYNLMHTIKCIQSCWSQFDP